MKNLPIITAAQIALCNPCDRSNEGGLDYKHELLNGIFKGWKGNALDVLALDEIPIEDRLWVVFRPAAIGLNSCRELRNRFAASTGYIPWDANCHDVMYVAWSARTQGCDWDVILKITVDYLNQEGQ